MSISEHANDDRGGSSLPGGPRTVFGLLNPVLRYRDLVFVCASVLFLIVAVTGLLQRRTYSSFSSFTPEQSIGDVGVVPSLAMQFGFGGSMANESPEFYMELLRSRGILGDIADTRFTFETDTSQISGILADILDIKGESEPRRRETVIEQLLEIMTLSRSSLTSVVMLSVRTNYPELSLKVNLRALELLDEFNLARRQSKARAERRFAENRVAERLTDLVETENALQRHFEQNRDIGNSPELQLIRDRLQREISRRQGLYNTVSQAYEQARIEEVRDTPVITLLQQPELAVRPDRRGLIKKGLLAIFLGGALGVMLAYVVDFVRQTQATANTEFAAFVELRTDVLRDLRHPWRPLQRLLKR